MKEVNISIYGNFNQNIQLQQVSTVQCQHEKLTSMVIWDKTDKYLLFQESKDSY